MENEQDSKPPAIPPLPPAVGSAWMTGTPPHSKPGTNADHFLCIPIESDVPVVLVYIHDEKQWTKGGGDTQKVRWWMLIPPTTELSHRHESRHETLFDTTSDMPEQFGNTQASAGCAPVSGSEASATERIRPKSGTWCVLGHSAVCDNLCALWCCKFEHQAALLLRSADMGCAERSSSGTAGATLTK